MAGIIQATGNGEWILEDDLENPLHQSGIQGVQTAMKPTPADSPEAWEVFSPDLLNGVAEPVEKTGKVISFSRARISTLLPKAFHAFNAFTDQEIKEFEVPGRQTAKMEQLMEKFQLPFGPVDALNARVLYPRMVEFVQMLLSRIIGVENNNNEVRYFQYEAELQSALENFQSMANADFSVYQENLRQLHQLSAILSVREKALR